MIIPRIQNLLFGTLRRQLIFSVALVHAAMMTLFIWDLTQRQRDLILERQEEQAAALARALAISAAGWLAAEDISGLQELTEAQSQYPELEFAMIVDQAGRVLAHSDRATLGVYVQDIPKQVGPVVLSRSASLVDIMVPVLLSGNHVGWVRVGVGQKFAGRKLLEVTQTGGIYALVAILIGSLFAGMLGRHITRRLYHIQAVMEEVRQGRHQARSTLTGTDEAAGMASDFNMMLDMLEQREAEVRRSEEKQRFLLQNLQVGVVVHDPLTKIVISNDYARNMLGVSTSEIKGKLVNDPSWHFLREDGSRMPSDEYPVQKVLSNRVSLRNYVIGIQGTDGAPTSWALASADPMFLNEELSQILVSFVDITKRREVEQKLESRNSLLSAIINSHQDIIIFALDREYRYTIFNEAHRREMRKVWKIEIAPGMNLLDCMTEPVLWKRAKDSIDRALQGEAFSEEQSQIGSGQFYEFTWSPIWQSERIVGVTVFIRDISERKRAMEALRQSEGLLADAARIAHIGYWDRDFLSGTITLSEEACRIFGLPPKRMFPKLAEWHEQWKRLIHPDDWPGIARALAEALAGTSRYDVEYRVVRSSGEIRHIHSFADVTMDESGKAVRMFGTMIDITESTRIEQERMAHVRFLESLDRINRAIQGTNDVGRMMNDVLEEVLSLFDCDRAFLLYPCDPEAPFWNVPMERTKAAYPGLLARYQEVPMDPGVARTLQALLLTDGPLKFGPGTEHPLPEEVAKEFGFRSLLSMALYPKVGKPWQFGLHQCSHSRTWTSHEEKLLQEIGQRLTDGLTSLLTYRDMQEAKEKFRCLNDALEQRVKERTCQLEAANKELEAFSYSVAHDLRAPLRHIDGFIELLQVEIASTLNEKCREFMVSISDSARKMGRLIDDLLVFSRLGRSEMSKKRVDFGSLVQEVVQELESDTKGRVIVWKISTLPNVPGDRNMLRQALFNLISNAVKYTRPRAQSEIEIGCIPGKNVETIFIRDNGVGFNMKYAGKLFGVFQRLHRVEEFEGNGIGLANVRRIISRHGGATWAEGKENHGATFFFTIPQQDQE